MGQWSQFLIFFHIMIFLFISKASCQPNGESIMPDKKQYKSSNFLHGLRIPCILGLAAHSLCRSWPAKVHLKAQVYSFFFLSWRVKENTDHKQWVGDYNEQYQANKSLQWTKNIICHSLKNEHMLIVLYGKKFMPVKQLLPHACPEFNSHFPLPLDQKRKKKTLIPSFWSPSP